MPMRPAMTLAALLLPATGAQAQASQGVPPPGMGMSDAMKARDAASSPSVAEQVDRARQNQRGSASAGHARLRHAKPATPADLVAGAPVADADGQQIGTVDRIDGDKVVVASAGGRVAVPANAFGKDGKGLLLALSKADFDKLVAQANATVTR